jgi:glutamate--cysteine ligase
MSAKSKHIAKMVEFYESGIKTNSQKLGVELEYTLVYKNFDQVKYYDEFGQKWLMEALKDEYPTPILDEANNLIGVKNDRDSITLEPAGQFELSAGPFKTIDEVEETFSNFENKIDDLVTPRGIEMIPVGYHPKLKAEELTLIPKVRYSLMNQYFLANSPRGIRMMRATGSTQVSIDYSSEEDCLKKLICGYILTPIFALLCDNTPIFEGKCRTRHLMRTKVWEDCDPRRCGIVPGVLDDDFSFEKYATYVLNAKAMFEMDDDNKNGHLTNKTTSECFGDRDINFEDCANASSHLFNDVRLKNFIEIRPADALPLPMMLSYVALIKGIFYGDGNVDELLNYFGKVSEDDFIETKKSLENYGFDGEVYGKSVSAICEKIVSLAQSSLPNEEKDYLATIEKIVSNKQTLADTPCPL